MIKIKLYASEEGFVIEQDGFVEVFPANTLKIHKYVDTISLAILSPLYRSVCTGLYNQYEVKGQTYGDIDALEQAIEKLIMESEGGAGVNVVDELPEQGEEGSFYVIASTGEMFVYVEGEYIPTTAQDAEKTENKANEINAENEDSETIYPSNKAVKDYVLQNKGMTDDEQRTVSEALNDLNSRDIALTTRVEALEEKGGGASAETINYDPTANTIKDKDGNTLSFADVKQKVDAGIVTLSYYGGMGIGDPYILSVIGNTPEAVSFALTSQGNDGEHDLISTWLITYSADGTIVYKVVNVSEGQGGGSNDWQGSQEEYDALTPEEKLSYDKYYILEE